MVHAVRDVRIPIFCVGVLVFGISLGAAKASAGTNAAEIELSGRVVNSDAEPVESAIVSITYAVEAVDLSETTDGEGRFRFSVPLKLITLMSAQVIATSQNGDRIGYAHLGWNARENAPAIALDKLEIMLAPVRHSELQVIDRDDEPIADAHSALQMESPYTVVGELSNTSGIVRFRYPENERVKAAVAWKDGLGLDYRSYELSPHQQSDQQAIAPELSFDEPVTLQLTGAVGVRCDPRIRDPAR